MLITIRSNPNVKPYTYFTGLNKEPITSKTEAFADDVTLTLPYNEDSLRTAVAIFKKFSKISGLTLNQGKTQVMIIGKQAGKIAKLAPDLGLNWVNEITILGIKLYPDPKQMLSNFDDKVDDIKQLLNRWTFRNLTVFARIQIVKSLGLSKLTHVVQIVPNPPSKTIKDLQKKVNDFIWEGGKQKKHVINEARSQQSLNKGGLGVPNVMDFWNGLKCTWIYRLAAAADSAKWKKLALRDLRDAMNKQSLDCENLTMQNPRAIAEASKRIANSFWSQIWAKLPTLIDSHNSLLWQPQYLAERLVWGTTNFTTEDGEPLNPRHFLQKVVENIKKVGDIYCGGEVNMTQLNKLDPGRERAQFFQILDAISRYMVKIKTSLTEIKTCEIGPNHSGWSRILTGLKKSRDVYNLIQREKQGITTRNENEAQWKAESSVPTMTEARWDSVYKNLSLLKCNLRVKYQEWRIAWKRQELNRDKRHYPGCTPQSTKCSYCNMALETETHIYTQCTRLEPFWREARDWVFRTWGILPPLTIICNRLYGMEKESPADLMNIFYRSVRYAIYKGRVARHMPCLQLLQDLMLDELKRKYSAGRLSKFINSANEQLAIVWFKLKMKKD